jgi:hypothetical protein
MNKTHYIQDPAGMTPQERRDALVDAFAEGIVYLSQQGLLPLTDTSAPTIAEQPQKPKSPNVTKRT